MRYWRGVLAFALGCAVIVLPVCYLLCRDTVNIIVPNYSISHEVNHAYSINVREINLPPYELPGFLFHIKMKRVICEGDGLRSHRRSPLQLFENGVPLGPAHSLHADIRADGKGDFSHWANALYFSTSDNSDPRMNRRVYVIRAPVEMKPKTALVLLASFLLCGGVLCYIIYDWSRSDKNKQYIVWAANIVCGILAFASLLYLAIILFDVTNV